MYFGAIAAPQKPVGGSFGPASWWDQRQAMQLDAIQSGAGDDNLISSDGRMNGHAVRFASASVLKSFIATIPP